MKAKRWTPDLAPWKKVTGLILLLFMPFGQLTVGTAGDNPPDLDPCELEAMKAYWQALKLCELADNSNPNPRLRCYEAAKAVYLQTLKQCRENHDYRH